MSDVTYSPRETGLDLRLGENTKAFIETALARGYEIGAVVLLFPSPASNTYKWIFVINSAASPELTAAFSEDLESHGFALAAAPPWARQ